MPVPIVVSLQDREQKDHTTAIALVGAALSFGMHLGLYSMLSRTHTEPPVIKKPVDIEIVEKVKPPPPPPKPPEEKKPEPPKPEPVKPKVKLPPPPKLEKPPPPAPPPPPNQPPPPPDNKPPPPINIGLSLSSTTQGGAFAAPVGNTLYGKPDEKAHPPSEARPYQAPPGPPPVKFVPSYQLSENPTILTDYKPPYPEEAKKEGLEGQVVLELVIDAEGRVTAAKVLHGDGHGFDEAAVQGARKLRFKPAKLNGEAVETKITYTMTFLLN